MCSFIPNQNIPPENVPFLQVGSLKYWRVKHTPNPGRQFSVFTSDPSIAMHVYGGGREEAPTYMYCYRDFKIGFLVNRLDDERLTEMTPDMYQEAENGIYWQTVTQIGTPVVDNAAASPIDSNGRRRLDLKLVGTKAHYPLGFGWRDYFINGVRTKFESRAQQDEMTALWPFLLLGLAEGTDQNAVVRPGRLRPKFRFSDRMLRCLETGELIA